MKLHKLFFTALLFVSLQSYGQLTTNNEKPQTGEAITITYQPSGLLTDVKDPIDLIYYTNREDGTYAFDGIWKKADGKYTYTIQTTPDDRLVMLKIFSGKLIDNNHGEGYLIPLFKGDEYAKGTLYAMGSFYESLGQRFDVNANPSKALEYYDDEYQKYPDEKLKNLVSYTRTYNSVYPDKAHENVDKAVEFALKNGLKDEDDYTRIQQLYALNKLTQQSRFFNKLKQEKFPNGKWTIGNELNKFMAERDEAKKMELWKDIKEKIENKPDWATLKSSTNYFLTTFLNSYKDKGDWAGLDRTVEKLGITGADLANFYNSTAWNLQEKKQDLDVAERYSKIATQWAKNQISNPTEPKPNSISESEWKKSNEYTYSMYADTYAMVLYQMGDYKKGLPYAEESAITINKGERAAHNNTYALLASKVYKPSKFVPILEKWVKEGTATSEVKDILKAEYIKKNGEAGYNQYMSALEKESLQKLIADLRKSMLEDAAPTFTLRDLDGKYVSATELKGRIVVVDFWATWCGPCKASFPGMQKVVTKYKNDSEVKFVFVDTWETVENKEKNAADFIRDNKYDFHVLMDNDNKVVDQFNVSGIPTKFVIDKNGKIRFKSIGFNGSDDGLVQELTAMIEIAREA